MSRTRSVTTERIFVASPNDMQKYREVLPKLVDNLNLNFLHDGTRELKLVTAMDDVAATIDGNDPQDIINRGVDGEFEFIIVIFGARVGTETPREISATIEEFRRAFDRAEKHGSPIVQVYFCRDLHDPYELDAKQLLLLHEFRDVLRDKGLYKTFTGPDEFEKIVSNDLRIHLKKRMDQVKRIKGSDGNPRKR